MLDVAGLPSGAAIREVLLEAFPKGSKLGTDFTRPEAKAVVIERFNIDRKLVRMQTPSGSRSVLSSRVNAVIHREYLSSAGETGLKRWMAVQSPETLAAFKRAWEGSVTTYDIGEIFGIATNGSLVSVIAEHLGLPKRQPRKSNLPLPRITAYSKRDVKAFEFEFSALFPGTRTALVKSVYQQLDLRPLKVAITTVPNPADPSWKLKVSNSLAQYPRPHFLATFAVPETSLWPFPAVHAPVIRYPDELAGDLLKIRLWLEHRGVDIISDDDMGGKSVDGGHLPGGPKILLLDSEKLAHRRTLNLDPLGHRIMWALLFHLGEMIGAAYVGPNGSTQATSFNGKSSFAPYLLNPFKLDASITGAVGVVRGVRDLVPASCHQEFSMASAVAVASGLHTLTFMPFTLPFHVGPPSEKSLAAVDIIRGHFPEIVLDGNPAVNDTCVVKFKTMRTHTLDSLQELYLQRS